MNIEVPNKLCHLGRKNLRVTGTTLALRHLQEVSFRAELVLGQSFLEDHPS